MADTENGSTPSAASSEGASTSADTIAAENQATDTSAPPEKSSEIMPPISSDPWDAPFGDATEEKPETEKSDVETDTPKNDTPDVAEDALLEALLEDEETAPDTKEDAEAEPTKETKSEELSESEKLIEALPTNAARKAARVNEKKAEVIRQIQFNEITPEEFDGKLNEYNSDFAAKYSQHSAYSLIAQNPDASFQRAYVEKMRQIDSKFEYKPEEMPTLDNVIARLSEPEQTDPLAFIPSEDFSKALDEADEILGFDWRDPAKDAEFLDERELALARVVREALKPQAVAEPEKADPEKVAMEARLKELENGKVSEEQQAFQAEAQKGIYEYRNEIETKLFPNIAKIHGLSPAESDTPQMKAYKENLMVKYQGSDHDRAKGYASEFEIFATEESTVAADLNKVYERVATATVQAIQAEKAGDKTKAANLRRAAQDEKVTIFNLISRADKEFYHARIAPFMTVIQSLGAGLTQKISNSGKRIEVVSGASGASPAPPPQAKTYDSADDVWNSMPNEILAAQKLRAA